MRKMEGLHVVVFQQNNKAAIQGPVLLSIVCGVCGRHGQRVGLPVVDPYKYEVELSPLPWKTGEQPVLEIP